MFILWDGAILGSLESLGSSSGGSSSSGSELAAPAAFQAAGGPAGAVAPSLQGQEAAAPAAQQQPLQPQQRPRQPRVEDPLAALSASSPAVGAEISAFSFLAVATSFIGFVLGLTDFVAGALALPSRQAPAPYLVALLPPLVLAVSFPGIFLTAIDTAGTYGVLTLFGILPCAMAWSARYGSGAGDSGSGSSSSSSKSGGSESSGGSGGALRGEVVELVPGGKPAARAFSSSGPALSDDLHSLIKRELQHEQTTYEQPEPLAKGPPAPFTVSGAPGDGTVTLKRDYKGETISVDAAVNLQEGVPQELEEGEEDEGDEGELGSEVVFNVTVTKGESSLVFECVSDGTYLDVRHVSHEPASGPESATAYTGPAYDELPVPLQEAFGSYLEERGINEDLGEYLRHAVYDKEQREYIGWLERVKSFLGAKCKAAQAFSSSGPALSDDLHSLIKRELQHEQTTYEQPEPLAKGPPAPFTVSGAPGDGTVTLKRDYKGETISVDAAVNLQEGVPQEFEEGEEDEGDEGELGSEVTFNVTVTKGESSLVFECVSDGTYLDVRHVSHEPAGAPESETAYTGPAYDELPVPLQEAFGSYLEERGINEDLGEYLRHAVYDKEQREYIGWLERVKSFLGAK
ncbi:hypothetical protein MNEG_4420 [Monoraphidium neglectum]|uniref:Mitochondrial glycoprotein n=1 Tax=Monoraphidium neglectum TaxID=145388 RepID=A0A0D2JY60_9CHLO|nr:hypothetical protein MNEG_4420 [Monoraphidium neglectum]KIZ03538.1 hypothetical protein MNEG_4420 [Monoraphidium neglectum]|eukprot:XP_013902557.1 hypothetical protein MNEG_4420 [Monoraphidium neglectum]